MNVLKKSSDSDSKNNWRLILKVATITLYFCGVALSGCGSGGNPLTGLFQGAAVKGKVFSGNLPLEGASVELYALGSSGSVHPARVLKAPVITGADGAFITSAQYSCPSTDSKLVAVVHGRASQDGSGKAPALGLLAAVGDCKGTPVTGDLRIDELTTLSTVYALSPLLDTLENSGSVTANSKALAEAFQLANELQQTLHQAADNPDEPTSQIEPTRKLMTLAAITEACLQEDRDKTNASTCSRLFSYAPTETGTTPTDTAAALFEIAKHPAANVAAIYALKPYDSHFQPALSQSPADWGLAVGPAPQPPVFYPSAGTYALGQAITLSESAPNATVFYNQGHGWTRYTAPIMITSSAMIQAVAVGTNISQPASAKYDIAAATVTIQVPQILLAGQNDTASILLNKPAPAGGITVHVSSTSSMVISCAVQTVIIPAGETRTKFVLRAGQAGEATVVASISASNTASAKVVVPKVAVTVTPAGASLQSGQSQQFSAAVAGSSNVTSSLTLSPAIGTLSAAGLYTAPASILAAQDITLTATSNADSSNKTSAVIHLVPSVSVTMTPSIASLRSGQPQQFIATVTGSSNTVSSWSVSPAVGTLSTTGLYTAPAGIPAAQDVTVTASSNADPSKKASAIVHLVPTVAVTLSPSIASLQSGRSQQFSAAVSGSSNTATTWTMSPAMGTLSAGGFYTAPGSVAVAQDVTLTATSNADSSKNAISIIHLLPTVAVTTTPSVANLRSNQSQQFFAVITGSGNTSTSWTMSPTIGTLSATGLYTAPSSVLAAQDVLLTATSNADSSKKSSAIVHLAADLKFVVELNSPTVAVGAQESAIVSLSVPAPKDLIVTLTSTSTSMLTVTTSAVITAGQTATSITYYGVATGTSTINVSSPGVNATSATVTVIPAPVPASFFGMSVQDFKHLSPDMPYATARSWDAFPTIAWTDVNPARGSFDFDSLDSFIQLNSSRDIIYTFGRTPRWASSKPDQPGTYGPGQCAAPADLAMWDEYVRAIVTHAAGRIKYWELWNEPSGPGFYCSDMPTLVTMASHAWSIIKAIDPTAIVLSPPMTDTAGPSWAGYFLYLGGARYIDVVAFHGYSSFLPEDINGIVAKYRVVMAANGVGDKPLWDTESSWAGNGNLGTPTMQQQVSYIARSYALHMSQGVSRFVWYAYDGGLTWGGLMTSSGQPSAATTAYIEVQKWMMGASLTTPCTASIDGLWTCGFTRRNGYTAQMLWTTGSAANISVPSQFTEYRDLAGNAHMIVSHSVTVSNQPILLETKPLAQN